MDKEQNIEIHKGETAAIKGNLYAAHEHAVPEGLTAYIENEVQNGKNVYIDMHGNVAVREAYAIPKVPSVAKAGAMVEGEAVAIR